MRAAVVSLFVALAGCGRYEFTELPDAPARLTETHFTIGGVEFENGIYDDVLQSKCRFEEINGSVRCVPESMTVVFADAACTQEIGARDPCDTDIHYIYRGDIDFTGDMTRHIYRAGTSLGTVPMYIRNGDPQGCTAWSSIEGFTIGEEVAIEQLVPGALETITGTRLDTVSYVSPDGIEQLSHYVDRQLGLECAVNVATNGFQCAPIEGIAYASYSTTAACDDHVAVSETPPAVIQFHDFYNGCTLTDFSYFSVAGPIAPATLYQGTSSCTALASLPTGPFYVSGAPLDVQTFVETPDSIPGQRVVLTRFTGSPDVAPPYRYYDTQLGVPCYPQTMSDGSVRCVPEGVTTTEVYSEGTCTTAVTYGVNLDFANCPQQDFAFAIGGGRNGCVTAYDVYEIGPLFTGLFWVKDQAGGCTGPYSANGEPRYWELGRKLDPSELVEATLP